MSIGALDAANAYGRALGINRPAGLAGADKAGASEGTGNGFGAMVAQMVTDTASSLRGAETASARQVAGKGDLIDVVTAMGAAETALDTVVAVRDRVVSAYSDIMRMQI
jgi:flagellar hook-basal body complex protein FliE